MTTPAQCEHRNRLEIVAHMQPPRVMLRFMEELFQELHWCADCGAVQLLGPNWLEPAAALKRE